MRKLHQHLIIILFLTLTFLSGCGNSAQQSTIEKEVNNLLAEAFAEPDIFFEYALENFENNDIDGTQSNLDEAILFMKKLVTEEDSTKATILQFAIIELEDLKNSLGNDDINEQALSEAFSSADASIAAYHLAVVSDHIENGAENKDDFERLERALARLEHAGDYKGYQLTENEKEEINAIQASLKESQKTSSGILDRIRALLKKSKKKLNQDD